MKTISKTLLIAALTFVSNVATAGTTGAVRGSVIDAETAEPLAGVTVIATSPALQGEEATLTDDQGRYTITGLPPGSYQLRFEFAGATTDRGNVGVSLDKTITLNVQLSSAAVKGEVYNIEEAAPTVDVASTTLGISVTKDYIDNVPQGRSRSIEGTMSSLPSATADQYGTSVSGATSPENNYVIDGLNTTDPAYGLMGSRLILDFVDELELKEGGYGAEYGRATGGFVNIVTKSGSNEFHGTVFAYYRPGFLEASRKLVIRAGESVGRRRELGYYLNAGFEVGGPIVKDKLWFHVGYAPEVQADTWYRDIYARDNGPDADGNGTPDAAAQDKYGQYVTKKVQSNKYTSLGVAHQFRAKLTHAIDANNRHSLTVSGAPTMFSGARTNDFNPSSPVLSFNSDPKTFQFDQTSGNVDAIYKYQGKFWNDKLQLEGWVGWHHQKNAYLSSDKNIRDQPMYFYEYPRDLRDVQASEVGLPDECNEYFDDGTSRCVVENYTKGGLGQGLVERIFMNRWTEKLAATHLFDFAGLHQVKYGADLEQNSYYNRRWYPGGAFYTQRVRSYGEYFRSKEFFQQTAECLDPANPALCPTVDHLSGKSGTHNWALFLQDSWNPMPTFTLNYGIRWEAQEFYGVKINKDLTRQQEKKFAIYDNFAPRIGAMWDFLGNGRSKVFAHWGRFYESIPLDLADRGFTGEGLRLSYYDAQGDISGRPCTQNGGDSGPDNPPITKDQVTNPATQCPSLVDYDFPSIVSGGEDTLIAPGLKGQYSEETIVGAEVEIVPSWVAGFTGIHRALGNVIEDVSTDGGNTYMVANPGNFNNARLDELDREIAKEKDPAKRATLQTFRDQAAAINNFPKPQREFYGLQFQVDKKLSKNYLVRASYLVSWTYGNYPGLFQDNNGQLDPNVNSMYDLPSLTVNRTGDLPNDYRHRIKIDGYYQAKLEEFGMKLPMAFTLGASGRITSGGPIDAYGADLDYGTDEAFLLPRGTAGRLPWTWSADLHIGARYNFDKSLGAELFVDLFNVTNNQQTVAVDTTYTTDDIVPIKNGTEADLPYATNIDGEPIRKNPNYKQPIGFQAPFSGQFGARVFF